jgi:hypothetical protein
MVSPPGIVDTPAPGKPGGRRSAQRPATAIGSAAAGSIATKGADRASFGGIARCGGGAPEQRPVLRMGRAFVQLARKRTRSSCPTCMVEGSANPGSKRIGSPKPNQLSCTATWAWTIGQSMRRVNS